MHEEIMIAGEGGGGVLTAGYILLFAGTLIGKKATWVSEYGPATRGGKANCTVIISDEEIGSPISEHPSALIITNQQSLEEFLDRLREDGLAIINSSLIKEIPEKEGVTILGIEATELAERLGNDKVANMIMLGAYIAKSGIITKEIAIEALEHWLEIEDKEDLFEVNKEALLAGMQTKSPS